MFSGFVYNSKSSDMYGVMCVSFDNLSLNTDKSFMEQNLDISSSGNGHRFYVVQSNYEKPISFKMQIINKDGKEMTVGDQATLCDWLCCGDFKPLYLIDAEGYEDIEFNAMFCNPTLIDYGKTIGIQFIVQTDSPFLITREHNLKTTLSAAGYVNLFLNTAVNEYIYPKIIITPLSAGNLEIYNDSDLGINRKTQISNCSTNEVLTIDCENLLITSSKSSHECYNDFNKIWVRLVDGMNKIYVSIPSIIEIKYRELRKGGI